MAVDVHGPYYPILSTPHHELGSSAGRESISNMTNPLLDISLTNSGNEATTAAIRLLAAPDHTPSTRTSTANNHRPERSPLNGEAHLRDELLTLITRAGRQSADARTVTAG